MTQPATRSSFRIPLSLEAEYAVTLDGMRCPLHDLSVDGISVSLAFESRFSLGQVLTKCDLTLSEKQFDGIQAQVVHISPGEGDTWLYGLMWINMADSKRKILKEEVLSVKKLFLARRSVSQTNE